RIDAAQNPKRFDWIPQGHPNWLGCWIYAVQGDLLVTGENEQAFSRDHGHPASLDAAVSRMVWRRVRPEPAAARGARPSDDWAALQGQWMQVQERGPHGPER